MTISVWHEQANVPVTVLRVKGEVRSNAALQTNAKKVLDADTCKLLPDAGVMAGHAHTVAQRCVWHTVTFRLHSGYLIGSAAGVASLYSMYDMLLAMHGDFQRHDSLER